MALSNWDTMAFGPDGQPCDGTMQGFGSAGVEIYKNWLYIHSKDMWVKGDQFTEDTIAQIHSGDMWLGGLAIIAKRGPQDGIFVYVESSKYHKDKETERRMMAGIGCSGYSEMTGIIADAMGVDLNAWDGVTHVSAYSGDDAFEELWCMRLNPETGKEEKETFEIESEPRFESQWIGVTQETYNEFIDWLSHDVFEEVCCEYFEKWLEKVKAVKPQRFNQGDAFFADKIVGQGPLTVATDIGKENEPIITKALGK